MDLMSRHRGCLLGLACGDAVGTTVEFCGRGTFPPVTDMTGGGPFRLPVGAWTDDTSMALCLASSLVELGRFDAADQMQRYCKWYETGYLSSTGRCFDIGLTTRSAMVRFMQSGDPFSGNPSPTSAGNGCIMRLAPVPMFFHPNTADAMRLGGESALSAWISGVYRIESIAGGDDLCGVVRRGWMTCSWGGSGTIQVCQSSPCCGRVSHERRREHFRLRLRHCCLEASAWCFWKTDNFRDAVFDGRQSGRRRGHDGRVRPTRGGFFGERHSGGWRTAGDVGGNSTTGGSVRAKLTA